MIWIDPWKQGWLNGSVGLMVVACLLMLPSEARRSAASADGGSATAGSGDKVWAFNRLLNEVEANPGPRADLGTQTRYTKDLDELWKAFDRIPFDAGKSPGEAKEIVDAYVNRFESKGRQPGGEIGMLIVNAVENIEMQRRTRSTK